ncbi:MAG: aldo/keto reductase [Ruminococcaceae bacterium]|nr:aldo/keto reductase [Oscillospiraceae bacterium]
MKKILLPSGLTVSEVALGAMMFGSTTSKEDSYKVLDAYVGMGGNFIDTSNNYAHWAGTGDESETLLGEWLADRKCRENVILATKVGFDRHGKGAGLKKEQIEYWVDESLRKLKTDYIDLYYAHTDDPNTPIEETMEAFDTLVKKGKVRTLGSSNFDTWRLAEANMIAEKNGWTPYTAMQQRLTYLNPRFGAAPKYAFNEVVNRERLRYLYAKNMPLISYSCLCKGAYENDDRLPPDYEGTQRLAFIRNMAKEKGVNPSALVIAWLTNLHRCEGYPRVIPLFSATYEHLIDNLRGLDIELTDEELKLMNSVI